MTQRPIQKDGGYLNQLTVSQFLAMVGNLPWNIIMMDRKRLPNQVPD